MWKDSVTHDDGHMSLHIYLNPQAVQHQGGTLMQTVGSGGSRCINGGSQIHHVYHSGGVSVMKKAMQR